MCITETSKKRHNRNWESGPNTPLFIAGFQKVFLSIQSPNT